jgi:hypothetical protein
MVSFCCFSYSYPFVEAEDTEVRVRFTASHTWLSRLIRVATGTKWSHCEIELRGVGYLGSVWRGGAQIRPYGYSNPFREDVVVVKLTPEVAARVYKQAKDQLGKNYPAGVFLCTGLVKKAFEGVVTIRNRSWWSKATILTPADVYASLSVYSEECGSAN